jgi:hypothetical protein
MAVDEMVATGGLQFIIYTCQARVLDLNFCTAFAAYQVVVVPPAYFIDEVSAVGAGRIDQSILYQEIQGAVHRGFRQAWQILAGTFVDLDGREMLTGVMQDMQDGHTLRGHAKSARTQLGKVLFTARHKFLIERSNNNILSQEAVCQGFLTHRNSFGEKKD